MHTFILFFFPGFDFTEGTLVKEKIWAVIAQNESSLVSIQLVIIKLTSIFQFAFFSTVVNGFILSP